MQFVFVLAVGYNINKDKINKRIIALNMLCEK